MLVDITTMTANLQFKKEFSTTNIYIYNYKAFKYSDKNNLDVENIVLIESYDFNVVLSELQQKTWFFKLNIYLCRSRVYANEVYNMLKRGFIPPRKIVLNCSQYIVFKKAKNQQEEASIKKESENEKKDKENDESKNDEQNDAEENQKYRTTTK